MLGFSALTTTLPDLEGRVIAFPHPCCPYKLRR